MWAEGPAEIDLFSDRFGLPIVPGTRSRRFPSAKTWSRLRHTSIRGHTRFNPVRQAIEPAAIDVPAEGFAREAWRPQPEGCSRRPGDDGDRSRSTPTLGRFVRSAL